MIARVAHGWQLLLADLALILFIAMAASLEQARPHPPGAPLAGQLQEGDPVAIYRDAPGAPPLLDWLKEQEGDPRLQLTVLARFAPAQRDSITAAGLRIADQVRAAGRTPRLVIEPGQESGVSVFLAFDAPPARGLARGLHNEP